MIGITSLICILFWKHWRVTQRHMDWYQACLLEHRLVCPSVGWSRARLTKPERSLAKALEVMRAGEAHIVSKGQTQHSVLGSLSPVPVLTTTFLDSPKGWGGSRVVQSR